MDSMVNSIQIDMKIITQLPSNTAITVSRPSVVMSDIIIVYTGN